MPSYSTTTKLLQLSDEIINLFKDKDELTQSDFQACLEAQIYLAYLLGREDEDNN